MYRPIAAGLACKIAMLSTGYVVAADGGASAITDTTGLWITAISFGGASALSALVGYVELLQRYSAGTNLTFFLRDNLARTFMLVHAIAGGVAWIVLPELSSQIASNPALHAGVAGLGALAILRLSFMNVGSGDKRVSIGPGALVDILVANLDQRIDQNRAADSIREVAKVVDGLNFERAARDLTAACAAAMERLPEESGRKLAEEVSAIQLKMVDERTKLITLGIVLRKYVGLAVLGQLLEATKEGLSAPLAVGPANAAQATEARAAVTLAQLKARLVHQPAPSPGDPPPAPATPAAAAVGAP